MCTKWTMRAKCHSAILKASPENETSFTHKLASHRLITAIVSHEKTPNGHATQYTINPAALTPNLPIAPWWEPAVAGRHIIYSMIECCCPRMEGLIFPCGILSQSQCCSCIPREWVTSRARGKELHLRFLCSCSSRSCSWQTTRKHIERFSVAPLFLFNHSIRYKHRHKGESQDVENKSSSLIIITHYNVIMCSSLQRARLHEEDI